MFTGGLLVHVICNNRLVCLAEEDFACQGSTGRWCKEDESTAQRHMSL